jgi:hypothetical protein
VNGDPGTGFSAPLDVTIENAATWLVAVSAV